MNEDWATKAVLHISRSLVLDISDDGISEAASIVRSYQSEHERGKYCYAHQGPVLTEGGRCPLCSPASSVSDGDRGSEAT